MERPRLGRWALFDLSVANMGSATAFALQQGNMARIFQTLGANLDSLPILMIAGPVTGLVVQPLIGHFSDRTWGRFGRRRPYFLGGALCGAAALAGMAFATSLAAAVVFYWILDTTLNVVIEPFRALVGETVPARQRASGLAINAALGCLGAVLGFLLPFLLARVIGQPATAGGLPASVHVALILSAAVLLLGVGWTVVRVREYSPEELVEFASMDTSIPALPDLDLSHYATLDGARGGAHGSIAGPIWLSAGLILTALAGILDMDAQLYVLTLGIATFGALQWARPLLPPRHAVAQILADLGAMPGAMRKLAVIHTFTWFALFIMWPFMTPVITQYAFHALTPASPGYDAGADWTGTLFAGLNVAAALFGFFILPGLARRLGNGPCHALCLTAGVLGFLLLLSIRGPYALFVPFAALGIAWASLLTLPYVMLTDVLGGEKLGIYMGIFNFFVVLPQLLVAAVMGPVLRAWFPHEPIWTMLIAALALAIAAALTLILRPDRANA